jgi:hypothetical protein
LEIVDDIKSEKKIYKLAKKTILIETNVLPIQLIEISDARKENSDPIYVIERNSPEGCGKRADNHDGIWDDAESNPSIRMTQSLILWSSNGTTQSLVPELERRKV